MKQNSAQRLRNQDTHTATYLKEELDRSAALLEDDEDLDLDAMAGDDEGEEEVFEDEEMEEEGEAVA